MVLQLLKPPGKSSMFGNRKKLRTPIFDGSSRFMALGNRKGDFQHVLRLWPQSSVRKRDSGYELDMKSGKGEFNVCSYKNLENSLVSITKNITISQENVIFEQYEI